MLLTFAAKRKWAFAAAMVPFLALNSWNAFEYALPSHEAPNTATTVGIRVMQMNIWQQNKDYGHVYRCILDEDPDLIGIEEYTNKAHQELAKLGLLEHYPYYVSVACHNGGTKNALISKFPLRNVRYLHSSSARDRTTIADIAIGTKVVTVAVLHPMNPTRERPYERNCMQLETLATLRKQLSPDLIVIGDMNTTHFSPTFKQFLKTTDLRDSRAGFGPIPTWPAFAPVIPIDFVLVSPTIKVEHFRATAPTGSDHVAVLADLAL